MEISSGLEVKNKAGDLVALLTPEIDGVKECFIDTRLNGESTLEFYLPSMSDKINDITPESTIWVDEKVFILLKEQAIDTVMSEDGKLWYKVMTQERWKELDYRFITPSISNDPLASPPAELAVLIVGAGTNLSGGLYTTGTAAHALYAILQSSGWTMGTVDVTGIHDLEKEKVSILGLIQEVQKIWGGFLVFDSVNKMVHLRDPNIWQDYDGFSIRYAKNMKHITRTQSNKIITKLYPFGHDDLGIAAVNGGKNYITNYSYTANEYIGIYKNQDIYNQAELLAKGTAELELNCRPRYNYKVKIIDLRTLPEYSHEDFELGDMVDVEQTQLGIKERVRLIRHKYNVFTPWKCELEIGDPLERLIEQMKAAFNANQFINGVFNGNGEISGKSIEVNSISASKIKTNELIVGDNITMGPNAYISWSNVTSKPTIPVLPSYIQSTYIDSTSVLSPTITGGTITGTTIQTGYSGSRIVLNGNNFASYDSYGNKRIAIEITQQSWGASDPATIKFGSGPDLFGEIGANQQGDLSIYTPGRLIVDTDMASIGGTVYFHITPRVYVGSQSYPVVTHDAMSGYLYGYATQSWVSSNYIKYTYSPSVTMAVTENGLLVRSDGSTLGFISYN